MPVLIIFVISFWGFLIVAWYHNIRMIAGHWPFSETEIMSAVFSDSLLCFQVNSEGRKYPFSQAHSWTSSKEPKWGWWVCLPCHIFSLCHAAGTAVSYVYVPFRIGISLGSRGKIHSTIGLPSLGCLFLKKLTWEVNGSSWETSFPSSLFRWIQSKQVLWGTEGAFCILDSRHYPGIIFILLV